ncbi:MAG: ABC transporter ATP-binding protein [Solirubrobacteraceae bacterium]
MSTQDGGAAVELAGLSKHYGEVQALADVSLSISPGRFLALLGPSGSGKSTLIRCLAGIERPSVGSIAIAGQLVADRRTHTPPERRDLAMVFQDFALWPHMSVLDNVRFALRRRRISRGDSQDRAQRMLDRVGLAHKRDRYPHELSGGEQQRVALARALVGEPRLLLFDEPLSSLDASLRERLRIEIGTLVRECGASAVYITHDQSEAFALGDEVGVLQAGRLIQIGAPEEIYRRPAAAFVARFTGLAGSLGGRLLGTAEDLSQPPAETDAGQATQRVRVAVPTDQPGRNLELEATAMAKLSPGAAVEVLIRPTAARICGLGKPATLLAMVRDVAYCGRGYEYVLELGAEVELTGVFDARRLQRGEHCAIALDPEGCLVFGQEEPAAPQSLPFDALPGGAEQTHSQGEGSRESEPIARLTR